MKKLRLFLAMGLCCVAVLSGCSSGSNNSDSKGTSNTSSKDSKDKDSIVKKASLDFSINITPEQLEAYANEHIKEDNRDGYFRYFYETDREQLDITATYCGFNDADAPNVLDREDVLVLNGITLTMFDFNTIENAKEAFDFYYNEYIVRDIEEEKQGKEDGLHIYEISGGVKDNKGDYRSTSIFRDYTTRIIWDNDKLLYILGNKDVIDTTLSELGITKKK